MLQKTATRNCNFWLENFRRLFLHGVQTGFEHKARPALVLCAPPEESRLRPD
jgi:hypothetical protein